jgi:hypothetical protein
MKERYYQSYTCGKRLAIKNVAEILQNQKKVDSNQLANSQTILIKKNQVYKKKQYKKQDQEDGKPKPISKNVCELC